MGLASPRDSFGKGKLPGNITGWGLFFESCFVGGRGKLFGVGCVGVCKDSEGFVGCLGFIVVGFLKAFYCLNASLQAALNAQKHELVQPHSYLRGRQHFGSGIQSHHSRTKQTLIRICSPRFTYFGTAVRGGGDGAGTAPFHSTVCLFSHWKTHICTYCCDFIIIQHNSAGK